MMELILSIIVPVYNVQRYLKKCIDSLLSQDIEQSVYEIILVDDGSIDDSGMVCDTYAAHYPNVSVIHQKNQGLSVARNVGLEHAGGKYVLFIDSDDFIQDSILASLVECLRQNDLDILRFKFTRVNEDGSQNTSYAALSSNDPKNMESSVYNGHDYLINHLGYECYAWQFLLKRDLLIDNNLFFKPGIIFEDSEWTPRIMEKARRVSEVDIKGYYYLQRDGSITKDRAGKVIRGQLDLIDLLSIQMSRLEDKRWYQGMIAHITVSIITRISTELYQQRDYYLNELKQKGVYPLSLFNSNKSAKRKIRLINISPRFCCCVIHFFNP